jgi:hypothetical protein
LLAEIKPQLILKRHFAKAQLIGRNVGTGGLRWLCGHFGTLVEAARTTPSQSYSGHCDGLARFGSMSRSMI